MRPNDQCQCGSGRKFKKCCANIGNHQRRTAYVPSEPSLSEASNISMRLAILSIAMMTMARR